MFAVGWSPVRPAWRDWPARKASARELALVGTVDLIAVTAVATAWTVSRPTVHGWGAAGLLVALAILFDEGSRRAARLQIRMSAELRVDLSSVWAVAAAVALSPAQATVVILGFSTHAWFRHQRPAHEPLYRKVFVLSTAVLGSLAAGLVCRELGGVSTGRPWAPAALGAVVFAMLVYTVINRVLVSLLLMLVGSRAHDLVGTIHENLIEVATLCLGGLLALAVVYAPWLTILVLAPMITLQRGALVRDLEVAATTDAKTGLLNATAWEQVAQREIVRALRENQGLAVLIADIDHFKVVNDRFGHLVGDEVLRSLASRLAGSLREYDTVGRFGGEEFVAVLPDVSVETAVEIAERVRAQINAETVGQTTPRAGPDADLRLAVSVGVACLTAHGVELSDLLRSADQALYAAKAAGRNRVRLAGPPAGPAPVRDC